MPELPDVEIFRRYLESTSLHQDIESVDIQSPEMLEGVSARRLRDTLRGNRLQSAGRHGKHLFARLQQGGWLVLHFGMTGFLAYFQNPEQEPRHVRMGLHFSNGFTLAYDCQRKLGRIGLTESMDRFVRERELGPDPLDPDFDLETFRAALTGTRSSVKSALMDQSRIAGIGNIYSDEILFQAGIHPATKAQDLSDDDIEALYHAMTQTVLPAAIEAGADPDRLPSSFVIPHRRKQGACPRCGRALEKRKISGRTAYFCPHDQPEG